MVLGSVPMSLRQGVLWNGGRGDWRQGLVVQRGGMGASVAALRDHMHRMLPGKCVATLISDDDWGEEGRGTRVCSLANCEVHARATSMS